MKTIVTGGAGFIGSHLVRRLVNEGREVVVAGDFSQSENDSIADLGSDIECCRVDLRNYEQALTATEGAETVFHLAARVGSLEYLHGSKMSELSALQTNLVVDANTFRACRQNNVKRVIYASSSAVYPMSRQESYEAVLSEDDINPIDPDGGYGWAKLMGEIQLGWMKDTHTGIARLFNIYGENSSLMGKSHVVVDLIRKAIFYPEERFIVGGDGKPTRDFLHVSDCVDALMRLETVAAYPPVIVNVGLGEPTSIGTIAEKIVEISQKKVDVEFDPTRPAGPLSRTADITKAKAMLRWQPKVSLDDGLRRTYSWVQKKLAEGVPKSHPSRGD